MATLSKESIETGTSKETAVSPASTNIPPAASQIHSDAVSLEVALKVHGSKVGAGARAAAPPEPFEEQTSSMIVFPHGGVLRMATQVNVGQMLVLTNLKTRQDAICRVVKVRTYSNAASYVEVEFTHRQPGYWGVYFESEGTEPAASPSASTTGASGTEIKSNAGASAGPSSRPAGDESTFIHFGLQEETQPAASTTDAGGLAASKPLPPSGVASAAKKPAEPSARQFTKAPEASSAIAESESSSEQLAESSESRADRAGEALGSRLGSGASTENGEQSNKKYIAIGAGAAALIVAIILAAIFANHQPAASSVSKPATTAQQGASSQPETIAPTAPVTVTPTSSGTHANVIPTATAQPVGTSSAKAAREMAVVKESPVVRESPKQAEATDNSPAADQAAPAPVASAHKTIMPSVFGTLNAHPTAPTRSLSTTAPNINAAVAAAAPENTLLGITSPATGNNLPAPALNPNVPVSVGGRVKTPALVKNVLPQYPVLAQQSHTQGNVVLDIIIDKAGNVTSEKVISGPTVLRQAAADAVRGWKYAPTVLDGQPISVQMTVTLRFQL